MTESASTIIRRRSDLAHGVVAERSGDLSVAARGHQRMGVLLRELDSPQLAYRTLHIAGSKGKGTTAHVASALLSAGGLTTGRYTSPHLLAWNERIAVDGRSIADVAFDRIAAGIDRTMLDLEQSRPELGQFNSFELLTAVAFVYFREMSCDIAVVEVGLGGRFDSTNHLEPSVSVITRIEEEHVDILGPTIREIAWNKAGIMQPNVPVVVTAQASEPAAVIRAEAEACGAPLLIEGRDWHASYDAAGLEYRSRTGDHRFELTSIPGAHNAGNIGAALTAVEIAANDLTFTDDEISALLSTIRIPGRFDRRSDPQTGRMLILDVAHTPESIRAFIRTALEATGYHDFPFIVALLSDKAASQILTEIAPFATQIVFPHVASSRAIQPAVLADIARGLGVDSSPAASVSAALARIPLGSAPVLVTGSFGVVSDYLRHCQEIESLDE